MNAEIAKALVHCLEHPDIDHFVKAEDDSVTGQGRWETYFKAVYRDQRDDTFWRLDWSRGSTEYQDSDDEVEFFRVYPLQVTQTVYKRTPA